LKSTTSYNAQVLRQTGHVSVLSIAMAVPEVSAKPFQPERLDDTPVQLQ